MVSKEAQERLRPPAGFVHVRWCRNGTHRPLLAGDIGHTRLNTSVTIIGSRNMKHSAAGWFVAVMAFSTSGCILAAAGAGAGSGIYLTSRGVESVIPAPIDHVATATELAFGELGIQRTALEVDDEKDRRVYRGTAADGGPDVTVTLEAEDSETTKVETTARTGAVTWDKDYAREVTERIAKASS